MAFEIRSAIALAFSFAALVGSGCSDNGTSAGTGRQQQQQPSTTGTGTENPSVDGGISPASAASEAGVTVSSGDPGIGPNDAGGAAPAPSGDAAPIVTGDVTYYADIKPFVDAKCVRCHVAGTVAPFALDGYELLKEHGALARASINAGTMPPWLFADGCNDYLGDYSLSADEKAKFNSWVDANMPEGDPTKEGAPMDIGEVALSRVDVELEMPEMYTSQQEPDEYRCFPVPWPEKFTTDTFMTGFKAVPGNPRVVHHVETYYVPTAQVQQALDKDAADPGPGYTCFGGPGVGNGTVGGWAPGSPGYDYPPNVGIRVEAGSAMIIQIHYNTQTAGQPEPDQSKVQFKVDDNVVEGGYDFWTNYSWVAGNMPIPANNPDVNFTWTSDPTTLNGGNLLGGGKAITLYMAALHMHNLGIGGYMHLVRADGSKECIFELAHWDFHWQGGVRLKKPIVIQPGDKIEMDCRYNNSAQNQPVYQGKQQAPRDVNWGDGTTDEMCLGILLWGQP